MCCVLSATNVSKILQHTKYSWITKGQSTTKVVSDISVISVHILHIKNTIWNSICWYILEKSLISVISVTNLSKANQGSSIIFCVTVTVDSSVKCSKILVKDLYFVWLVSLSFHIRFDPEIQDNFYNFSYLIYDRNLL